MSPLRTTEGRHAGRTSILVMGEDRDHSLSELARHAGELLVSVRGDGDVSIRGLSYDSRAVSPGDLFFCVPGMRTDGHRYAAAAVGSGAVALCVERPTSTDVPEVAVTDARRAMALISAGFYGRPADDLLLIGVTGTNGKTTTTYLIESILRADGKTTGLIGTVETRIAGETRPGVRTTPESIDLQRLLSDMRARGVDSVAVEVTSHALVLHRIDGARLASAAFTNLSQDHLDFHTGMEDYFAAKRSLFVAERLDKGAINIDDPFGQRLQRLVEVPCVSFGLSPEAEIRAVDVDLGPTGSTFVISTREGQLNIVTSLVGSFNVSNCLAAAAACMQAGIDPVSIEKGIAALPAVPGRFQSVNGGQPFSVIVDYAHTPDSLDNLLRAARTVAERGSGRVIVAFGAGGDRDRSKRPLMGAVAARFADVVIVTSDNPRSEEPNAIIDQILEGVGAERSQGPDEVEPDRARAILDAIAAARPGDVVVIAGKGHETGQELADRTIPFDDRIVAAEVLEDLGYAAPPQEAIP
jgi:UDP-N-acetylmuramoyl-L-alanyl-D-glutamate--2,6-diaminopimelate ligase